MSVVKADAYGHGALSVAHELHNAGTDWFAVSNLDEALELRRGGITSPILIFGYTPVEHAKLLSFNNISQTVFDLNYGLQLAKAAKDCDVCINVHIKIDTGMSRLGFFYHDNIRDTGALDEIEQVLSIGNLFAQGIYTHFSKADDPQEGELFTRLQFDLFLDAVNRLNSRGIRFEYRHCCNSAAIVQYREMHLDMVRPGLILYGLHPSKQTESQISLKPVMELKTIVSMIKDIPAGTPVSYGGTFVPSKDIRVATVPIGYADGYSRGLSKTGHMLIGGHSAPVIGRVCMDQTLLDITGIPGVECGMPVTVFGKSCGKSLPADELALKLSTINYEIVCSVSRRVPRIYIKDSVT
jgi:alanine racemase